MDVERVRAAQDAIHEAAAQMRSTTIAQQYAGLVQPVKAFSMALMLDELARHARELPDDVCDAVTAQCREITAQR